jgi:hypothetical protein
MALTIDVLMAGLVFRFATMPGAGDADLRMTYCAFVVCTLLNDWSCIDLPRALSYIQRCRVRVPISPLFLPSSYISMYKIPRHTKADTDKHQRASRSADQRIAPSRRCTSFRPTTHVRRRRACSALSGTRRCAGCCTCRRRRRLLSAGVVLRGARINWRMRVTGSGVVLLLPYANLISSHPHPQRARARVVGSSLVVPMGCPRGTPGFFAD